jgi:YHS domain-containing protein
VIYFEINRKGVTMKAQRSVLWGMLTVLAISPALASDTNAPASTATEATAAPVKRQTVCPVMGGEVDKTQFVDYDGKRIYVCCGGCIAKIKKDPAKYVKQLEAEGGTLDKAEPPKDK